MTKTTLSFRTDPEIRDTLDRLAAARRRDRSFLINEAIENYIADIEWEKQRILEGIDDARRGDFATDEEVEAVFAKWRKACA